MNGDSKTLEGEILGVEDILEPALANSNGNPRSIIISGLEAIRLIGERRSARLRTELASYENDCGDQMVRAGEITLCLRELEAKIENGADIAETAKLEVIGDRLEAENRVEDLKAQQRTNNKS